MDVRRIPADSPDAARLLQAMVDNVVAIYGGEMRTGWPSATAAELTPPDGQYVAVYDGEEAIAGGGVKRLGPGLGEIKRMYVEPDRRGQGVARLLLGALEDAARDLGYERVRLDTGAEQPHARALYESAGYFEVDDYNANPYASYWAEKRL